MQASGRRFLARARVLSAEEKSRVWDDVHRAIPQMRVYEDRTDRDIRVYCLSPVSEDACEG